MSNPQSPPSRYELREVLGRGGMGVIYRAYDNLMKREVALKTILDPQSTASVDLFYREWGLQASITHPNIAEIYDIGEMVLEGAPHPYFVMPLLPGTTLSDIIRDAAARLTAERCVNIIVQICRGLQAAHEKNLIHRDLKPSNIFVMTDDSVKIIDFGIAFAGGSAQTSVRGTLAYMAPELLEMKPATAASDIYAVGVLSYEMFARRRPFEGASDAEVARAIMQASLPALSELNPTIPLNVSRAIHKAMARQPWHRFSTAREFGDTILRAYRGEPIQIFDSSKVAPRIERAARAFERAEYDVATEILNELQSEGYAEEEITLLRRRVEQARRQVLIRQLLDSARRYSQEEEHSLALRKVQEALDLDPKDTDAQALRHEIEKARRAKKIQEWAQLARQHLDNNAFAHARGAVESLLELRPNDTAALELLAEIQRREQEFEKLRSEKGRLYSAAREAWRRGEVTSALTNLDKWMRLEESAPETDAERAVSLRNFYHQVRSEHEALNTSYEKARQLLAAGSYAETLSICQQYLSKYPGHALFQALKFDAEEAQRQALSALIAETDRKVESEPDLDRRVAILEEALRGHPGEPHFERALKLTKDKRDLVASVVSRARLHEDENRFAEALDQWEILRSIHPSFPGLEYEIARVAKRRDAQTITELRSQWVSRIDAWIEARDFDRAISTSASALAEFPDDPEITELQNMARQKLERQKKARALLAQGQAAVEAGDGQGGMEQVRSAFKIDPQDPVVRSNMLAVLSSLAEKEVEANPAAADVLINEILRIDPNHPLGLNLRALRSDKDREQFVSWCTAQARKLQASGDLDGALVVVQEGLGRYPNDVRLNQLLSTLDRSAQSERSAAIPPQPVGSTPRGGSPAEKPLPAPPGKSAPPTPPGKGSPGAPPSAPPLPSTPSRGLPLSAPAQAMEPTAAVVSPLPPVAKPATPPQRPPAHPAKPAPPPPSPVSPAPPAPSAAPPRPAPSRRIPLVAILAGVGLLLIGLIAVAMFLRRPTAPQMVAVELRASQAGARIFLGDRDLGVGRVSLSLVPGTYQARAELDGYSPASLDFQVVQGKPLALDLVLAPIGPSFRLTSEVELTSATLAGQPLTQTATGEYSSGILADGEYRLEALTSEGPVTLSIVSRGGAPAMLSEPIKSEKLGVVLLSEISGRVVIYSNVPDARAGLAGSALQPIPKEGLAIFNLPDGPQQIAFDDSRSVRTFSVIRSPSPTTRVSLLSRPLADLGSILVVTGEDGMDVFLDGSRQPRKTRDGALRIGALKPGAYKVAVSGPNVDIPAPREVEVVGGREIRVEFTLKKNVQLAKLHIRGPAGAQVFIDSTLAGAIAADGAFSADLKPGSHTVELRRGQQRSRQYTRDFKAAETVTVSSELALEPLSGQVQFVFTPPNAEATVRRRTDPVAAAHPIASNPASLPEGDYVIEVSAPGHASAASSFTVIPGETVKVPVTLQALAAPKPAPKPVGVQGFDDFASWTSDDTWHVRRGPGVSPFGVANPAGVFVFQVQLRRGKRVQWLIGDHGAKSYSLFQIDRRSFTRSRVRSGRSDQQARLSQPFLDADIFDLRITVRPDRIMHEIRHNGEWYSLDNYQVLGESLNKGRFAFLLDKPLVGAPDEYAVRNFQFRPAQ